MRRFMPPHAGRHHKNTIAIHAREIQTACRVHEKMQESLLSFKFVIPCTFSEIVD